jgi:hypothetical protein
VTFSDPYITSRCNEVDVLIKDATSWASSDAKLGAHLATYLNVMILGVVEDCIEHLIENRAGKSGDIEIKAFVHKITDRQFRNPDYGAICELLKEFSDQYCNLFKSKIISNGSEATALQSVVINKNNLAHTGIFNLTMSLNDADNYFRRIIPVLKVLEQILATDIKLDRDLFID